MAVRQTTAEFGGVVPIFVGRAGAAGLGHQPRNRIDIGAIIAGSPSIFILRFGHVTGRRLA